MRKTLLLLPLAAITLSCAVSAPMASQPWVEKRISEAVGPCTNAICAVSNSVASLESALDSLPPSVSRVETPSNMTITVVYRGKTIAATIEKQTVRALVATAATDNLASYGITNGTVFAMTSLPNSNGVNRAVYACRSGEEIEITTTNFVWRGIHSSVNVLGYDAFEKFGTGFSVYGTYITPTEAAKASPDVKPVVSF